MFSRNKKFVTLDSVEPITYNSIQRKSQPKKKSLVMPFLAQKLSPHIKKFHVRKLNTQQSRKNSQSNKKKVQENFATIQQPLRTSKLRFKGLRMHTQKVVNLPLKQYLYMAPSVQRSRTVEMKDLKESQKDKYAFLTKFEKQQVGKFEVLYIGKRRINTIKDFTNSSFDAKIVPGDSIAYRYEILSPLGQGSFGQVFKAFDHKRKQYVALKIIRNEPKFCKQAKVQIKILETALIQDPKGKHNIIQLKHGFFFRGHPCLSFEVLHINLYEFLKKLKFKGLGLDLIRRICIQILQGLLFLGKQNIIHCDLKPENILLKQQNKTGIKIIDIGSGTYIQEQIYTYIQSRFYRAPEIILGISYTPAIDIWSLGCILCELLIGYPIFPGQSQADQMLMFMEVLGIPPEDFVKDGTRSHKFFQGSSNIPKVKPTTKGKLRRPNTKSLNSILECRDVDFIDFVKKFFIWDPLERITPAEALLDPWIVQGLPEQIRKQHISMVKKQMH